MNTCKNCLQSYEGKFCPECGQKAKTGRITITQVFKDIRSHFVHFEQGFLYTTKELIIRPGHSIKEYIEGRRARHTKPVKYMLWATAISFLVIHFLGFQEKLIEEIALSQGSGNEEKSVQMGKNISDFLTRHPSLLMLSLLPGIAFCSWSLFRNKGFNYAEHFTIDAFLMGILSLASIITSSGFAFISEGSFNQMAIIGSLQWVVWAAYFAWAYRQLFPEGNKFVIWIKGILVLILGYLVLVIIGSVVLASMILTFGPQVESWLSN